MRRFGLRWTRAAVAQVEAGTRSISLSEFFTLLLALQAQGVKPSELLGGEGDVFIAPDYPVPIASLPQLVTGQEVVSEPPSEQRAPVVDLMSALEASLAAIKEGGELSKGAQEAERARLEADSEAVQRAATVLTDKAYRAGLKLDVDPIALEVEAMRLWGRTLVEEREHRLAQDPRIGQDNSVRGLRGWITRSLLDELYGSLKKRRKR